MATKPSHPELAYWADLIERLRWAGFLLDRDQRLVWVSPDLMRFLASPPEEELGYGLTIDEALRLDAWRRIATAESGNQLQAELGLVLHADALARGVDRESIPETFRPLADDIEPQPFVRPIATSFDYLEPDGDPELPVMHVNLLVLPIRDDAAEFVGVLVFGYSAVRPGLVSLLARGDEDMYERMAKLVDPGSREAAILFCDLEGSTDVSRRLPAAQYFRLIRSLWTDIDALVAKNEGIVGKHAGDGASAFFLVDDLGSVSRAAAAAIRTAREIHERSHAIFGDTIDSSCLMRVGVHWGSSLYMGQLVPGGRLDVTALGDAVNECARIQEVAKPHQTLASKELIERLSNDDAATLGLDPEKFRYTTVADLTTATEKAIAGAGSIPVIPIDEPSD